MADKGVRNCSAGTVLFREGEKGDRMYVIKAGTVRVTKQIHDTDVVIEELGAGEFCGELAMLDAAERPVTAVVVEEATLIQVKSEQFEEMIRGNTDIALRMLKKLTHRLTESQYRVSNLILRSNEGRVLHQLRAEAVRRHPELKEPAPLPNDLADVLAIEIGEVKAILGQLVEKEFITINRDGQFKIVDPTSFDRYLRYLELDDRFSF